MKKKKDTMKCSSCKNEMELIKTERLTDTDNIIKVYKCFCGKKILKTIHIS